MQAASRIHTALKKGGTTFGAWQMLPGTNLSRAMASAGLDWITVDTEHGNIADHQMHESVAAIAAAGVSPIVRIAANEAWMVKRALDSGAHGLVVPLIETAEQVKQVVSAAKFPPRGIRGFGSPFAMGTFSPKPGAVEYLQQANDALVTCIQIETKQALANVEEIAAVDGVDVLFVGPFDLGNNIGHPILGKDMDEELKQAIEKIHQAATKAGKRTGMYCTSGKDAKTYADRGFHMICISGDMVAIPTHISQALQDAKGQ